MNWIYTIVAFALGLPISYVIWEKALHRKKEKLIKEAENEAEVQRKDKILQAKEKFLQLKSEHEKFINERNNKAVANKNRII